MLFAEMCVVGRNLFCFFGLKCILISARVGCCWQEFVLLFVKVYVVGSSVHCWQEFVLFAEMCVILGTNVCCSQECVLGWSV